MPEDKCKDSDGREYSKNMNSYFKTKPLNLSMQIKMQKKNESIYASWIYRQLQAVSRGFSLYIQSTVMYIDAKALIQIRLARKVLNSCATLSKFADRLIFAKLVPVCVYQIETNMMFLHRSNFELTTFFSESWA